MKVLIVKTSSLGDVLHTLPAVTDAVRHHAGIQFDWLVEEAFAEIPAWHPAIHTVIPVALRRWRRHPVNAWRSGEWRQLRQQLKTNRYDRVIDAQGLMKSAWLTRLARGTRVGLDRYSAREPLASLAYQETVSVARGQHAIERTRQLFARALGHEYTADMPDYGIRRRFANQPEGSRLLLLHGTTWPTKLWPENYWTELARLAQQAGMQVELTWGNDEEQQRAQCIAQACEGVIVRPRMELQGVAEWLCMATAAVAVDSGIGHLAAALEVPAVSLYGATNAALTGTRGLQQQQLQAEFDCAPCLSRRCLYKGMSEVTPACYGSLPPQHVWDTVQALINNPAQASTS